MDLREDAFDVRQLFEELHDMLSIRAQEKDLLFNFHGIEDLPPRLYADAGKLRQVLLNVLSNAIKYTQEGGVTLRARFELYVDAPLPDGAPVCSTPGRLYVEVTDSGRGIPPGELDTVFDTFTQSSSRASTQEGAGLGLAITRSFVQMMDGHIGVESTVDVGTTFFFDVAALVVEEDAFPTPEKPRQIVRLAANQPAPRVLIAEDRETNRRLLVRLMHAVGFAVRAVTDGKEAVAAAVDWQPHLILMDAHMPEMSGGDAARHIRAQLGEDVVIIALTASTFHYQRDELLAAGCDDYMAKPFRRDDLLARIGEHLHLTYEYNQAAATPRADVTMGVHITDAQIRTLDRDTIEPLRRAVTELDVTAGQGILERLKTHDPQLASILLDWLRQYRFDDLMTVIERWETLP
jgi:CheY-like chemotaxis protein/anti-sigma regulatory factor (Ser/Thr protein kinase)